MLASMSSLETREVQGPCPRGNGLSNGKLDVHYQQILREQCNSDNTSEVHVLHLYRTYKAFEHDNEQERK